MSPNGGPGTGIRADPRAGRPPELIIPGARSRIRAAHRRSHRRIAVLDDDPTGSQCVHGVRLTLSLDRDGYHELLPGPGATGFLLTNSRSLPEAAARALTARTAGRLYGLESAFGGPVEVISRSDSCLRGHVIAEMEELAGASDGVAGRPVDGILFVPALFGAGRFTVDDVHWAVTSGQPVPVAETEFARDATFGYRSSRLPDFLAERSAGTVAADDVSSISLDDIRVGGPEQVTRRLLAARSGGWIVVNALSDHDLDIVVLGVIAAQQQGRSYLYRTGPAFVRALAGIEERPALAPADIRCPRSATGHGLVVVGSHTRTTSDQLERLQAGGGLLVVDLDVHTLLDEERAGGHVAEAATLVGQGLRRSDVALVTSRTVVGSGSAESSLQIARTVSKALVEVVVRCRDSRPSWVLAKGGITSHDVALDGLGIVQADVLGQFPTPGISVLVPSASSTADDPPPFVVFPGNVGDPDALRNVVEVLRRAAEHDPTDPRGAS